MTQQHIDNDTLDLFVKTRSCSDTFTAGSSRLSSALYENILDHLASCEKCRDQITIINALQNEWSQLSHQSSLTEDQQQMICDYLDGLLQTDEAEKAKVLINNQPDAMKAALHYQSHVDSMGAHLSRKVSRKVSRKQGAHQAEHSTRHTQGTFFTDLWSYASQFFSIRLPVVYTITATVALFIAVFFLTLSPALQRNQTVIAAYQDNPTIQFTAKNKLPGVGFFSQSGNTSKPFEDIRVELVAMNTVKISWPEVDGAELYKMRIQVFNQGKKTLLKESSTQTNHTTFQMEGEPQLINHNRRYEWVLYGNTADDRMFYASGGFVISKTRAENKAEDDRDYDSW